MIPERHGTVPFSNADPMDAAAASPQPVRQENGTPPLVIPGKPADLDKYTSEAMRQGVIDEAGTLLVRPQEPLALDEDGRQHVLNFWKTTHAGHFFPWNLHSFLESLVHCFHTDPYKGSTIIQTQGTLCAVGQEFWQRTLHEKIKPFGLDACITSDMWNFCAPSHRHEFWVILPHEYEFLYLQQLAFYFWVLQALSEKPKNVDAALTEFMQVTGRIPAEDENPTERIVELSRIMAAMQTHVLFWQGVSPATSKKYASVEIFCSPVTSVKIVFALTPHEISFHSADPFRCEICPDETKAPFPKLIPVANGGWQALHDCLINRMFLPNPIQDLSTVEFALIKYCVLRTCGGSVLEGSRLENRIADAFMRRKEMPPQVESFSFGIPFLTPGNDSIAAYFSNLAIFFKKHKEIQSPDLTGFLKSLFPSTAWGRLLISDHFLSGKFDAILQIVGGLLTGFNQSLPHAPDCRQVTDSHELQIAWKTYSIHHVLIPFNFEEALSFAILALKHDEDRFLPLLAQVLDIFLPSFPDDVFNETSQKDMDPRLAAIYYQLRKHEEFSSSSLRFSLLLRGNGWRVIDESHLLGLPAYFGNLLSNAGPEQAELQSTLNQLAKGYQNTPYEAQFGEVRSHVLALQNPTVLSCQFAAFMPLLSSGEQPFAARAWTQYAKLAEPFDPGRRADFLLEMASHMPAETLPLALNRVRDFCKSDAALVPPVSQVRLVCTYLERMLRLSPQYPCLQHASLVFKETFISAVRSCIEIDPMLRLHILSYPQLADELFSPQEERSALLGILERRLSSDNSDTGTLMSDVHLSLPHFVKAQDKGIFRVIEGSLSLILKNHEEKNSWNKFAEVLTALQKEDSFRDESVILLERISGNFSLQRFAPQSLPFQCFRNPFPKIGRLSQKQKERLVLAYLPLLEKDGRLTGAFPPNWLETQQRHLKREETWLEFTRLFLCLNKERDEGTDAALVEDALWIAPRLFKSEDYSAQSDGFTGVLVQVSTAALATREWKPYLIELIVRNPAKALLFSPLIELAEGDEYEFFTGCKRLQDRKAYADLKSRMVEYQTSGKMPNLNGRKNVGASQHTSNPPIHTGEIRTGEIRVNILKELRKKPVPIKSLERALSWLRQLPSAEFPVWLSFFRAFPADSPKEFHPLLEESANCWFEQHPPQSVKPEEGTYWQEVLLILYRHRSLTESSFAHFVTSHAPVLLERLDLESCKMIAQFCMEGAVIYCMNNLIDKNTPVLEAINKISDRLVQNVEFPKALINQDDQCRLHLLFARQEERSLHEVGASWYLQCIELYLGRPPEIAGRHPEIAAERPATTSTSSSSHDVGSEGNGKLFTNYCTIPHLPRNTDSQGVVLEWFEKSWGLHRKSLNWNDACAALIILLKFNFDEINPSQRSHHLRQILHFWDDLHEGGWSRVYSRKASDGKDVQFEIKRSPFLYGHATKMLMEKLMQYSTDPLEMLLLLNGMRNRLNSIHRDDAMLKPALLMLRLNYCSHVFSLDLSQAPDAALPFKMALDDLHECRTLFPLEKAQELEVVEECKRCVGAFVDALPCLLNQNEPAIDAMVKLNIENLRRTAWVRNGPALERFSWESLLAKLCICIRTMSDERRNVVVRFTREVFMSCTHQGTATASHENGIMEDFIATSTASLALRFMTMPETDCLSQNEWDGLIDGLSGMPLRDAVDRLYQEAERMPIDLFWNCLAAARLVRHTKTKDKELLHDLQSSIALGTSPRFLEFASRQEADLRLRYLSHWILAISNFINRCDECSVEINDDLIARRIDLTNQLTGILFTQIKDAESFKKYSVILTALLSNLDVAVLIKINFRIDQELPVEVIAQLSSLRNTIDRRIAALEERITPRSSVTLSHLIRRTKTDDADFLNYLEHLCIVLTSPRIRALVANLEVDYRLHYLSGWILTLSNMMARWDQTEREVVVEELIDRKIELTREIIGVILASARDSDSFETYASYLIGLSKDSDVAEMILANLTIDPALPSAVIDSFKALKSQLEQGILVKVKEQDAK